MYQQNMDFDRRMAQQLNRMRQQSASQAQLIWQQYLQTYGPWLQQQYRQYVSAGYTQFTFEQFAYWMLITANGTDLDAPRRMQQRQFQANQDANRTVQDAYQRYNDAMRRNSQRQDRAVENWDRQVARGEAPYIDPGTGQQIWLPYSLQPGQSVNLGGRVFVRGQGNQYYEQRGGSWVPVNPAQR